MIYLLSDLDFCFKLFATPRSLTKVVHLSAHAFSVSLGAIFVAVSGDHFDEIIDGRDGLLSKFRHRKRGR